MTLYKQITLSIISYQIVMNKNLKCIVLINYMLLIEEVISIEGYPFSKNLSSLFSI